MKHIKNTLDLRGDTKQLRGNLSSEDLRDLRNKVSHYNYEKHADWDNLEDAISLAKEYLQLP